MQLRSWWRMPMIVGPASGSCAASPRAGPETSTSPPWWPASSRPSSPGGWRSASLLRYLRTHGTGIFIVYRLIVAGVFLVLLLRGRDRLTRHGRPEAGAPAGHRRPRPRGRIRTQLELVAALREKGYRATQATVSRDITEMGLVKVDRDGGAVYALPSSDAAAELSGERRLAGLLSDLPVEIRTSGTLVVIRAVPGTAHAIAAALDRVRWPDVRGTIAGDDTVFVACADEAAVRADCAVACCGWRADRRRRRARRGTPGATWDREARAAGAMCGSPGGGDGIDSDAGVLVSVTGWLSCRSVCWVALGTVPITRGHAVPHRRAGLSACGVCPTRGGAFAGCRRSARTCARTPARAMATLASGPERRPGHHLARPHPVAPGRTRGTRPPPAAPGGRHRSAFTPHPAELRVAGPTVYNLDSERRLVRLFSRGDVADRQDPTLTSRHDLCPARPDAGRNTRIHGEREQARIPLGRGPGQAQGGARRADQRQATRRSRSASTTPRSTATSRRTPSTRTPRTSRPSSRVASRR